MVVDVSDPECPWRFSPFKRVRGLTSGEQAQVFCAAIERMLGSLAQMRQLALNLHSFVATAIETDVATFRDLADLITLGGRDLKELVRRLEKRPEGVSPDLWLAMLYLRRTVAEAEGREKRELVASTLRAVAVILNDPTASRLFSSPTGNLELLRVLEQGHSLVLSVPPIDLNAQVAILSTVLGRLMALAMRRSSEDVRAGRVPIIYVVLDESQNAYSDELAREFATLRNRGVAMAFAHQSGDQPPYNDPAARSALESIRDNCSTRIYLRIGRKDAEDLAAEAFMPKGHMVKLVEDQISTTVGTSATVTSGTSTTESAGQTWTRVATWTQGKSGSLGWTLTASTTEGEQMTLTDGRASSTGSTTSTARSSTLGRTDTKAISNAYTESVAWTHTRARALSLGSSESRGGGTSESETIGQSLGLENGETGVALMLARENLARSSNRGSSNSWNETLSQTASQSEADGLSESEGFAESTTNTTGNSHSTGQTSTRSNSQSQTTSASKARGRSSSTAHGESCSQMTGSSATVGGSQSEGDTTSRSTAKSNSTAEGRSNSETRSTRTVRYTVQEETLLMAQVLQSLPNREVVMTMPSDQGMVRVQFRTEEMPIDPLVRLGTMDGLADLERLTKPAPAEPESTLPLLERVRAMQGHTGPEGEG